MVYDLGMSGSCCAQPRLCKALGCSRRFRLSSPCSSTLIASSSEPVSNFSQASLVVRIVLLRPSLCTQFSCSGSKHWPKQYRDAIWSWTIGLYYKLYAQLKPDTIALFESCLSVSADKRAFIAAANFSRRTNSKVAILDGSLN